LVFSFATITCGDIRSLAFNFNSPSYMIAQYRLL
jgi:hypothetical protein